MESEFRNTRHSFTMKFVVSLLVLALFSAVPAFADNLYAGIRGTVVDSTGAVVPDATVTATNVATGISTTATTNSTGAYQFPQLAPGRYTVKVTKQGFKTSNTSAFEIALNQIFVQNITLPVGETTETVTVEANQTQVESTSMQLGTVISGDAIKDLPLNGRNWIQLQQTQPGVVSSSDRFGSNFATNGSQSQQNSFLVNGADTNDLPLNSPLVIPSPDAIGEFNMVTNTINPEYGRNSGAILNATIKSGTNSIHGSAFDFYRDTFLGATPWFKKTPPVFHQNQFGGTIGGPLWKDHTFLFFSYQGARFRQPQSGGDVQVFTAAERNGDFSGAAGLSGTSPRDMVGEDGAVHPAGTDYSVLFPTNHVPSANFDPVAVNLMNTFVPLPNSGTRDFLFNAVAPGKNDQFIIRGDHTFNPSNTVNFTALWQSAPSSRTLPFSGGNLPGFGDKQESHTKQFVGAWNHTFSPNVLNEFRAGFTRLNFLAVQPQNVVDPASLGFNINPQSTSGAGVPFVSVGGGSASFSLGFSFNGPQPRIDDTAQITDNFTWLVGKHTFKMGFEGRFFKVNNPFFFVNNGFFDFSATGPFSTGNGSVDFLLGLPDFYEQTSGGDIIATAQEGYTYFQDQWKVLPNLTLTYGLGWQVDTALKDHFNHDNAINCFNPGVQSSVYPNAPEGLTYVGDPGCPIGGYNFSWKHVGPRAGFAWSPDLGWLTGGPGKTSIRGGFGLYFNRSEEELTLQNLLAPPFSLTDFGIGDIGGTPTLADPFTDQAGGGSIPNPFPFTPPSPGDTSFDFSFFEPLALNVIDPHFSVPYAMNYNLTIQRELPGRTIATLSYVGSQGRHLTNTHELNPNLTPEACAAVSSCRNNRNLMPLLGAFGIPGTSYRYNGLEFGSIGSQTSDAVSNYNSFQASVKKDTTHGLSMLASYTWSHSIDTASSFENSGGTNFNLPLSYDRGDSAFDARHRLVISATYAIPVFSSWKSNGFTSRVLDGWRVAGIATFQGGFPVFLSDGSNRSLTCAGSFTFYGCPDRPDQVGALTIFDDPRTSANNKWFDTSAFAHPAFGTFGNVGRNPFHGPGINNFDLALYKDIHLDESKYFEMRLEAFNAFNHAQFNNPSGNVNSGSFGRITSVKDGRLVQLGAKFYF